VLAEDMVQRFEAVITSAKVELLNTFPDALASDLAARYGIDVDVHLISDPIETILRRLSNYDEDDADPDWDPEEQDDPQSAEESGD
jgi:hypothetical protein